MTESNTRYRITWLIRRLFRAMAARADDYLAAAGLTAADRAVMEFLYPDERRSVPEIAGLYDVSRQHVQVTVNRLLEAGLVATRENPRHKRSPLICLEPAGRDAFEEIREQESGVIDALFDGIGDSDIDATCRTLTTLLERLD